MRTLIPLLALVGCISSPPVEDVTETDTDTDTVDTDGVDTDIDTDTPVTASGLTAVITTVAQDYGTGSLATTDVDTLAMTDSVTTTTGDPVVFVDNDTVIQLNRFGFDTVRLYTPGSFDAPDLEFSVGPVDDSPSTNPQAVAICDDALFVTLHNRDEVAVYDPSTGNRVGSVDLSAFNDGDGVGPEATSIVERGDTLYIALQRLDQNAFFASVGSTVIEVDCPTRAVTGSWDLSGAIQVYDWPGHDELLVTGEAMPEQAGGLFALDPATGDVRHVVDGTAAGLGFNGLAVWGEHAIAVGPTGDWSAFHATCIDLSTGTTTPLFTTAAFLSTAVANSAGEAWIGAHWGWLDPDNVTPGIHIADIERCEDTTGGVPIETTLGPTAIAFY